MSTVTIVSLAVIIFLIVFIIIGWSKGFLRIILTTLSLVATLVVAAFLLTPVSNFLAENTGLKQSIEKSVEKGLGWSEDASSDEKAADEPETTADKKESSADAQDDDRQTDLEKLIAALRAAGYDVPEDVTEEQLLDIYNSLDTGGAVNEQLQKDIEETVLSEIKLPKIIKNTLFSGKSLSAQLKQGIENFKLYIVDRISTVALKILTYVGLVIAIFILVRILLLVSRVLDNIPVLHGVNRFFGAIVGFIEAAMILWILCLIISLISQTEFGKQIVDVISQSPFLSYIYEENLVLRLINSFLTLF